jgi:hypothetical protein
MWPDSPFAKPISSFETPVPLVTVDPDEEPDYQVCFRKEWVPYVVGALQQLLLQTTWKTDDKDALNLVQARAQLLISIFLNACEDEMDVRQSPDDCNILQKTFDGIEWIDFANLKECITDTVILKEPKIWRVFEGDTQYSYNNTTYITYTDAAGPELGMPETGAGIPSGTDPKCIRAKNNVAFMLATFTQIEKEITTAGSNNSVVAAILGIVATLGAEFLILPAALTGVMSVAFSGGATFTMSLFTPDILQQLACDLEDAFESDGSLTTSGYQTFLSAIWAHGGIAWELLTHWFEALGPIGMVAAGQSDKGGVTTCDTDPCDDTLIREFKFLESPSGWVASHRDFQEVVPTITQGWRFAAAASKWLSGQGWVAQAVRYDNSPTWFWVDLIHLNFDHAIHLSKFDVEFYLEKGLIQVSSGTPMTFAIYRDDGTGWIQANVGTNFTSTTDGVHTYTVDMGFGVGSSTPIPANYQLKLKIYIQGDVNYAPPYPGNAKIRRVKFYGTDL